MLPLLLSLFSLAFYADSFSPTSFVIRRRIGSARLGVDVLSRRRQQQSTTYLAATNTTSALEEEVDNKTNIDDSKESIEKDDEAEDDELSMPEEEVDNKTNIDDSKESIEKDDEAEEDELSMPWTDFQDWALRDNLPRYVVVIPKSPKGKNKKSKQASELYALWRTMTREVTELSGYPIDFLQDMHARQLKSDDTNNSLPSTPDVLPLLDEFEFESGGGLSGRAYGIPGIADGTKIETSSIVDVQITVPKGYVRTEDGDVSYELGLPLRDLYSLDVTSGRAEAIRKQLSSTISKGATELTRPTDSSSMSLQEEDKLLVRLGGVTAITLAGATAIGMLSHHLTVNVFWV